MNKKLLIYLIMSFAVMGCKDLGTYNYTPYDDIKMCIKLKKLKKMVYSDGDYTFLYFELLINNNSLKPYSFHPGKLQAKVNGKISSTTSYDSLASVMPEEEKLVKGENIYPLYFAFEGKVKKSELKDFTIVEFGIRESN